ncbi:peptidoglycan-binding domain-containing protein [Streptomyces sp. WM6386]|uniref:peptidoglycan-binding domain-containing protein n=1 Tax=Streptomyces sp. WM6386 TaxID=1415558 RepID=UPI000619A935|nr:peptidoglycan-binding domain-containing protein [Streptomyces sp. WM6386]KKD07893.1 peptidoglycan-binding membrane protein [Streptomyces sp. WM6386]
MPTPPERGQQQDPPPLEPIRVLRPRRTDALAELFREVPQESARYESVVMPRRLSGSEDETQELPPVPAYDGPRPFGSGPGLRRAAVVVGVSAAALIGFGCALLLPGRGDATAAPPPSAVPTPSAATTPAATDPDGPGTLREGASGPEVTDLQQRLLRIPDVYANGSTSGTYDPVLTEAVARFQVWYGIRGDESGVYGDDTRLALESRTG